MNNLNEQISKYLEYCQYQKRLDEKTLKAYRIDLRQFTEQIPPTDIPNISQAILEDYIVYLHQNYKPKTVKRKIASVKALFHYLEYRKVIEKNPFYKMQIKFREPVILPKIIPLHQSHVIFLRRIYIFPKIFITTGCNLKIINFIFVFLVVKGENNIS